MKPKVIAIVGPTASGKTALAIQLAKAVNGEVISADSRQVYRGLDIGSGKVTQEETDGVPHHLLDVADPKEVFTAADFVRLGRPVLSDVLSRGKVPIIAGGTGFYIDALLGRTSVPEVAPNPELRAARENKTTEELAEELKTLDPDRHEKIDQKNPRRLMRAIEVAFALGKNPKKEAHDLYDTLTIGIAVPTQELREKIRSRLFRRLEEGMLEEAKQLHSSGLSYKRMDALGLEYRYMARHLQGMITREEMEACIESESVKYARRQKSWFKRNRETIWIASGEIDRAIVLAEKFLKT